MVLRLIKPFALYCQFYSPWEAAAAEEAAKLDHHSQYAMYTVPSAT